MVNKGDVIKILEQNNNFKFLKDELKDLDVAFSNDTNDFVNYFLGRNNLMRSNDAEMCAIYVLSEMFLYCSCKVFYNTFKENGLFLFDYKRDMRNYYASDTPERIENYKIVPTELKFDYGDVLIKFVFFRADNITDNKKLLHLSDGKEMYMWIADDGINSKEFKEFYEDSTFSFLTKPLRIKITDFFEYSFDDKKELQKFDSKIENVTLREALSKRFIKDMLTRCKNIEVK